ncbi:1,2-dihydroxy-3-keto-5-methylthiopentene dioxygenase [Yamadazyma tenuis]|uniref:Acireductone dioxygenase n=1 Tax=Candida tenuis (strain ATCC 10573 / BCRC 21748 / CBS 615 / JCM 9827 / NBRC 10315 / NRRL Y-1498 / VKM Y-70) TaxID=590646 RepID=G3BA99_CANTC|nr:Acireductone dioxygenase [Yamadazyma tenuis ATCC 10573]EGV61389.1 Acireductone dioxygenase [Yamadazyma tenuis ATCC 10573]WEJ92607.1 1,2-dihydroxy-3-keto-5-methylthiopentene dioxygenase [Yamadazyma tenuis]
MVAFFYHDNKDTPENFTDEHSSGTPVTVERLKQLGVLYYYVTSNEQLNSIAKARNYKNRDEITLNLDSFNGDLGAFNAKMAQFYKEHYHEDEEIRYIVDGEGYFDVRDVGDQWIRAKLNAGDMLILPAGIYHRFTLSSAQKNIKAVRLFKDEPKWEAINRDTDKVTEARSDYVRGIAV